MKRCPRCNLTFSSSEITCPKCGATLEEEEINKWPSSLNDYD